MAEEKENLSLGRFAIPFSLLGGHVLHSELRRLGHTGIHSFLTAESLTQQMGPSFSWRKPVRAVDTGEGMK